MSGGESELPAGDAYDRQWESLAGWFLGPRAENRQVFNDLMMKTLNWHEDRREDFFPADPSYFTNEFKNSEAARGEYADLEKKLRLMHDKLNKSIPFFSTRYQGHMIWENTMPSILGYVSGLLWNQNNVDSTASPVTTQFEVEVGQQLCKLMRFETIVNTPWGHITSCGSVANLEAMWAARNAKFHPLALKNAVINTPSLSAGKSFPVSLPKKGVGSKTLETCTTWELLNLKIDDICNMTDDVVDFIAKSNPRKSKDEIKKEVDAALENESCVQIGLPEFYRRHGIGAGEPLSIGQPRVYSPGTNHYSWPKASTVLGIGDQNVIPINVDARARQNIDLLRNELEKALHLKKPVMMVVAVIGSTEESSVDDLDGILTLRDEFALKGLTFSVHADAAWGGYLNCMTHSDPDNSVTTADTKAHDFVPVIPLSTFVEKQYLKLGEADTVTIDPHKAGFCPYPAGALLYRNGTMKGFITLAAPEVFHDENDLNVGVYGLEGSKPGAAACSVLLSHEVIGLDANGYGRILGQCQFGSKLFYCMWETVAREKDPFICMNLIAPMLNELDDAGLHFNDMGELHKYIEDYILGKSNEVIVKNNNKEMDFLKVIGPDALINQFTVNCVNPDGSGQQNTQIANELQTLVFNELTSSIGEDTKRVKMFLTTSILADKNYGAAVRQLKTRLGLDPEDKESDLGFLRNTCMEPYQASELFVTRLGDVFRNSVLNCIGALDVKYVDSTGEPFGDPLDQHTFLVVNKLRDGKVFLDYVPKDNSRQFRYQAVFRAIIHDLDKVNFKQYQQQAEAAGLPLFLKTVEDKNLFHFVKDEPTNIREVAVIKGSNGTELGKIKFTVDEVWEYRHFEVADYAEYNTHQRYFMYGDETEVFMSHIITGKMRDFYQVVQLASYPQDVPPELVNLGLTIEIEELSGKPLYDADGNIKDPLQNANYTAYYRGKQYSESLTRLEIGKKFSKEVNESGKSADFESGGKGHGKGRGKGKGKNH